MMSEREIQLAARVEAILGRDMKFTSLNDIIEQLVEVIENGSTKTN